MTSHKIQPIIIIGMHRSGTTMLTKMLRKMGLFTGWDQNDEYEAKFFFHRNEKILNSCGGSWDNPLFIDEMLSRTRLQKKIAQTLDDDLQSMKAINFLGLKLYLKYRSIKNLDIPWGWKDPRNTFLLPLWLDIFPQAKIIHIYRNGIDIAQSLSVREEKRIEDVLSDRLDLKKVVVNQKEQIANEDLLLYLTRKVQNRWRKMSTLYKYRTMRIQPCISIDKGFELWTQYVDRAFHHMDTMSNHGLTIKYEDFLLNPRMYLSELNKFCGLNANESLIAEIAGTVNVKRRFSYTGNEKLMTFYNNVRSNEWLEKLKYNLDVDKELAS